MMILLTFIISKMKTKRTEFAKANDAENYVWFDEHIMLLQGFRKFILIGYIVAYILFRNYLTF